MMDLAAMSSATQFVLTTGDFHAQVHALSPRIAVFDCDGTLWPGDSGSGFMRWTIDTGLLSRDSSDWMAEHYRLYCKGEIGELDICGQMVQVYRGLREQELRAAAARYFAEHVEPTIFPEMRQLIADLQRAGTDIWAVSSTNDWVVEEGVKRFNIPASRVLAARVQVADGLITDILRDIPSDEGKVASLQRNGITAPDAVFGNSIHDAAMLSIARRAFPVNPTPALLELSAQRNWPVYHPAAVPFGDTRCTIPNG